MPKSVMVYTLPKCQAEVGCPRPARYDCKSWSGPWLYTCEVHWPQVRASDRLGTGHGQYLRRNDEAPSGPPTFSDSFFTH